ncbi:MAG: hypothetical protein WC223_10540 [Bacteroidales bacterium]|jgi:hypothetical protein
MSLTLGEIIDNQAVLLGMDDTELGKLLKAQGAKVKKNLAAGGVARARGSRGEMLEKLPLIEDKEIGKDLGKHRKHIADCVIAVCKLATVSGDPSTNIKMITDGDNKVVGLSDLNFGRFEKDEYFLMSGLSLLGGIAKTPNNAGVQSCRFGELPDVVLNGIFELKANGKTLSRIMSCEIFRTFQSREIDHTADKYGFGYGIGTSNHRMNYHKLDNPKLIDPQQLIEMNITTAAATEQNQALKLILWGSIVTTY